MQSSTDAGNDGTRKYTGQQQQNSQAAATGTANQTTSFTVNGNNQQQTSTVPADTPSKNPFKQQLDSYHSQQNGAMETDRGILGAGAPVGKTSPEDLPYVPRKITTGGQAPPPPPPDQYRQEDPSAAGTWSAAKSWMVSWRGSNRLVLVIVAIALLLDNMLLTTVEMNE